MDQTQARIEILMIYWSKWRQWIDEIRKQRYQAVRVLQYQNELQQRRLRQCFKHWQQVLLQQKIQHLNRLRDSLVQVNNQYDQQNSLLANNQDEQAFNQGLAIKYHQKKTYSKCMRSWIDYGITSKRFQKKLSLFYIRFLIKKYFHVINDYRLHSINKKHKKAHIRLDNTDKLGQSNSFELSQSNAIKTVQNVTQIQAKLTMTSELDKIIGEKQVDIAQKQFNQTQQANSLVNFHRTPVMGQSRRSQFSTVNTNINYQSKRKFRPIMELPSIPDIQNLPNVQTEINKQQNQRYAQKSPMRFYDSRDQSQAGPYNFNKAPSLIESKGTQIRQEDPLKQKLMQILLKEQLISLAIISGEQFKQGMQYENYRQRTISSLKRIRQLKIV